MDWNKIKETVLGWLTTTGIKILVALLVLIVAFTLINRISKQIEKRSRKQEETKHVDKTVYRTLGYIAKIGLKILVVLSLVAYLGIDTGAITALIASLGVGVGLAVNGTLSNLAGGMLLLFTRPFKDGDYIAANGYEGYVEDIFICNTKIRTNDNKIVYLPNGKLSTSEIVNYTEKKYAARRPYLFDILRRRLRKSGTNRKRCRRRKPENSAGARAESKNHRALRQQHRSFQPRLVQNGGLLGRAVRYERAG